MNFCIGILGNWEGRVSVNKGTDRGREGKGQGPSANKGGQRVPPPSRPKQGKKAKGKAHKCKRIKSNSKYQYPQCNTIKKGRNRPIPKARRGNLNLLSGGELQSVCVVGVTCVVVVGVGNGVVGKVMWGQGALGARSQVPWGGGG